MQKPETKKILLFGVIPIYKSVKTKNEAKRYILGLPYYTCNDNGEEKVTRTFFKMLKKKKNYLYSKYYFLGVQIWCKKKSKVNILMDKIDALQQQTKLLHKENNNLITEFQQNIVNLQSKNNKLMHIIDILKVEVEFSKLQINKNIITDFPSTNSEVNICMITDDNYVVPTLVAMTSAISNKNQTSKYNFYLVVNNISTENIEKFKQLENDTVKITFVNADTSKYSSIIAHNHVNITACLKFDLCNMLNLNKILYFDGDILVLKDLSEFYNKDISNFYCSAVRDMGGELGQHFNTNIGIDKYFNSGVLLLNLERIRNENLTQKFLEFKLNHPQCKCMDQDALNYVMAKNTLWANVKYNCMLPLFNNPFYGYSIDDINEFYKTDYIHKVEMEYDAVIIHFAGESRFRPWQVKRGTYQILWDYYKKLSPIKDLKLIRN